MPSVCSMCGNRLIASAAVMMMAGAAWANTSIIAGPNLAGEVGTAHILVPPAGSEPGPLSFEDIDRFVPGYEGTVSRRVEANDLTGTNRVFTAFDIGPTPGLPSGSAQSFVSSAVVVDGLRMERTSRGSGPERVTFKAMYEFSGSFSSGTNTSFSLSAGLAVDTGATDHRSDLMFFTPSGTGTAFTIGATALSTARDDLRGLLELPVEVTTGVPFRVDTTLNAIVAAVVPAESAAGAVDAFGTGVLSFVVPVGYLVLSPNGELGLPVTAIPEPATWLLFLVSIALLTGMKRTRRRMGTMTLGKA